MNKKEAIFFIVVGILLIIGVAFSTVHVIDKKIGALSINMPEVKVPSPDVTIRLEGTHAVDDDGNSIEVIDERRVVKMHKVKANQPDSLDDVTDIGTESESESSDTTEVSTKRHNNAQYI